MTIEHADLEELRLLRQQADREAEGPREPPHLAAARSRLEELHEQTTLAESSLQCYELDREMASISQAIAPELRALERERREAQGRAVAARRALERSATRLYTARRYGAMERLATLFAQAAREMADLESLRVLLAEQFEATGISGLRNAQLSRLIADAERARSRLAEDGADRGGGA